MFYEGTVEMVIHVPVYASAISKEEADEKIDDYMNSKHFRDYCKKQLTKGKNSLCVIQPYNLHRTKRIESNKDFFLLQSRVWPFIWGDRMW